MRNKASIPTTVTSSQHSTENPSQINERKGEKGVQFGKEK